MTTDLNHLPNSSALKCYFHCAMFRFGVYQYENSTRLNLATMIEVLESLSKPEQEIYFRLGRGCFKRASPYNKDVLEFSYTLNVCAKDNDNEVRTTFMTFFLNLFFSVFVQGFFYCNFDFFFSSIIFSIIDYRWRKPTKINQMTKNFKVQIKFE